MAHTVTGMLANSQGKEAGSKTFLEEVQRIDLLDRDIKSAPLNISSEQKEAISKELRWKIS